MRSRPVSATARRVRPVVPPLGAEVISSPLRTAALAALAELAGAAAALGNPDLFHRPRFRTAVHGRRVAGLTPEDLAARITTAAEDRAAAGLIAVASVRAEQAEQPGRRLCFDPESLADLHRLLAGADPNIPGDGGFRRSEARVTWPDGRRFVIAVPAGESLRRHLDAWYGWATTTTSPPLDAAALSMVRLFTIHPFADGNGRTARLLAQCDLVGAGLLAGLLLDLEGWVHGNRTTFDEAVFAAATGGLGRWGAVFAQMIIDTARHRIATVRSYLEELEALRASVRDDPLAAWIVDSFRETPAVSEQWLGERTDRDTGPALRRLADMGLLEAHPRLPGAWVAASLLSILDQPYQHLGGSAAHVEAGA
jgi:hypothetical protein